MSVYYIEEEFYLTHTAGSKPRNDFNTTLRNMNFTSVQEEIQDWRMLNYQNDIVFIQYTFSYDWKRDFFEFCHQNKVKTVLFINDIASLHDGNYQLIEEEVNLFNKSAYLIVHNSKMKDWLIQQGVIIPIHCLELFDYLIETEVYSRIKDRSYAHEVIFAGNLNPSLRRFLYASDFKHDYQLNLYGPEVGGELENDKTTYLGSFAPDVIPVQLEGSFGLLWNGDSEEGCSGHVGYYSTIATPHKLSLYLLAKLPVICWEQASESDFVVANKLGFTVSSLNEIDEKLSKITLEQYKEMGEHIQVYSENIQSGFYFKRAIHIILQQLGFNS